MESITIHINTDNAAFADYPEFEVSCILCTLAGILKDGEHPTKVMDCNGNTVGSVEIV